MEGKYNLEIYFKPGATKEEGCFCNRHNPQCEKGYKGECLVVRHTLNPYAGIEECQANEHRTYGKVHGRTRSRRT